MADATADQIKFAQSRINYFEEVLNKGEKDTLKTLVKEIKKADSTNDLSAQKIAKAIETAPSVTKQDVDDAKNAAAAAETKLKGDIGQIETDFNAVKGKVADLVTKISAAQTAAGKITSDSGTAGKLKEANDKLGFAKTAATEAQTKLGKVVIDDIKTKQGGEQEKAIEDAKIAIEDAQDKINNSSDGVIYNLGKANDDLKNVKKPNGSDSVDIPKELGVAQTAATDAKTAFDGGSAGLAKSIDTAETDYADYVDKQNLANTIKEGDSPITVAAKAYNQACGNKIADLKTPKEAEINSCNTELFKSYGFINALLKNIPNAGKDVLTPNDGSAFTDTADLKNIATDNVKVLNSYAKIVATVCGTGPFVTGKEIPNPKDNKGADTTTVTDCLGQANKIAAAILADANCGKDQLDGNGAVKADCYKALAGKIEDLYNAGSVDEMLIDLNGKYEYDGVFPDLDSITV